MKRILRRLKRSSKVARVTYTLLSLAYLVSFIFFAKSVIGLTGIETFIRYLILVLLLGYFVFYYDELDKLKIEYKIVGNMICPDCYTLEDVEVPFDIEEVEDVTNDTLKEGIFLSTSNDEKEIIKQIILPIVPIKVSNSK